MSEFSKIQPWRAALPTLSLVHDPKRVVSELIEEISHLSDEDLCGGPIQDHDLAQAARAGLLLAAGGIDEAHRIAQEMETPEACYWHGIVHRREPDWANAKYWFRRLGHHAVFDEIQKVITKEGEPVNRAGHAISLAGAWNPFTFVDLCKNSENGDSPELRAELLILQQREIEMLLEYCIRKAVR